MKAVTKERVVAASRARTPLGKLLRRVEDERRSLVIEKQGTPKAVLLSIRDYVRLAAPEPEVLTLIGRESQKRERISSPPNRSITSLRQRAPNIPDGDDSASCRYRHKHSGVGGAEQRIKELRG